MLVILERDLLTTCVVLDFKYIICHYCFIVDHEVKKRRFGRKISPIRLPPEPYARSIRTESSLGWRNRWCEDHTACITQKSTSRWSWSLSEWYKTRFCQYCWVSKLCFDWNQVRLMACFRSSSIMHRVSPTPPPPPSKKILHKHRPQFLLDDCNTQEKWKTNVMKNSGKWGGGGAEVSKVYNGKCANGQFKKQRWCGCWRKCTQESALVQDAVMQGNMCNKCRDVSSLFVAGRHYMKVLANASNADTH